MKTVVMGFVKWMLSYVTVVFAVMFLPVFLLTRDFEAFDRLVNFLFSNEAFE